TIVVDFGAQLVADFLEFFVVAFDGQRRRWGAVLLRRGNRGRGTEFAEPLERLCQSLEVGCDRGHGVGSKIVFFRACGQLRVVPNMGAQACKWGWSATREVFDPPQGGQIVRAELDVGRVEELAPVSCVVFEVKL